MSRKVILLLLTMVIPASLFAQSERRVEGEYTYYTPQDVSLESARATAIEQARIQALANEYGTLIEQTTYTRQQNENGNSYINMLALGESTVKGEWLKDSKDPVTEVSYEEDFLMVTAHVWGLAREIVSVPIDISVKVLKNGTLSRFEDDQFRNGDDIYLSFQSPSQGYLAVYLMDDKGDAYCFLPYAGDADGMFEVKANKPYVLFSSNHAENGEACDEYVLTCEKNLERDMLYVIFSPNPFVKANDVSAPMKVKVGKEELELPRYLSYKDFQRWLLKNRRLDKKMQVVVKPIEITKE